MIKLYGNGASRWVRPTWTAREAGVPFEPVRVSVMRGETRTPEYRALQPFSRIPAMEDGDFRLFESAVMCVYIAAKNPEAGLVPTDGTRERALHDQWVSFVISDLDQPLGRITKHTFGYPEGKRSGADIELAREDFKSLALALEDRLPGPYLVGDRFTVADIVLCYSLRWSTMKGLMGEDLLDGTPGLRAYLERHMQRPSFPAELYG